MKAIIRFSLLSLLISCGSEGPTASTSPQAVRVLKAHQGDLFEGATYLGEVVPERTVKLIAQVPGTVSALPLDEGAWAEAGQELVRIDAPDVVARVSRVRAERSRAQRERDFACGRLTRDQHLAATGDVSPEQLDASDKTCTAANLAVQAAQAGEREASVIRARSTEEAPFDGQVMERFVEVGQSVMPGVAMMLYGTEERQLQLNVPESDVAHGLEVGDKVILEGGGEGTVASVGGWARGPGRIIEVRVQTDALDTLARVGGVVSAKVVSKEAHGTLVPQSAVGEDERGPYVLTVSGEEAQRVSVSPGARAEGWVHIRPDLPPDSRVIIDNLHIDVRRAVFAVEVER